MIKRSAILLAFVGLMGGSGYLLSSRWQLSDLSQNSSAQDSAPVREQESITIPKGTKIEIRLLDKLSTRTTHVGSCFLASIENAIRMDGREVVPAGSIATGVVTSMKESGRIEGRSYISLRLQSIELKGGRRIEIATTSVSRVGKSNHGGNLASMGGGAGSGAAIEAIASGGKGVAIGGPAGFGPGLSTQAMLRGDELTIPAETLLHFRLEEPIHVKLS